MSTETYVGRGHRPGRRPLTKQRSVLGYKPDGDERSDRLLRAHSEHLVDEALQQCRFRKTLACGCAREALLHLSVDPGRKMRATAHRAHLKRGIQHLQIYSPVDTRRRR